MNNKILAVDDNYLNLEILVEFLEDFEVFDTTDGYEVFDIVKNEKIDLILLDVVMPDIDGFEICKELKNDTKTKDIPIIFITSKSQDEYIEQAYKVGGVDYITKPFKKKELIARVETHLALSRQNLLLKELIEKQRKILGQESKLIIIDQLLDEIFQKIDDTNCNIETLDIENLKFSLKKLTLEISNKKEKIIRFDEKTFYDIDSKKLIHDNKHVDLKLKELKLLELFVSKINQTVSVEDIMSIVWEDSYEQEISKESVKSQVSKLRKKLGGDYIENVYGVGYTMKI